MHEAAVKIKLFCENLKKGEQQTKFYTYLSHHRKIEGKKIHKLPDQKIWKPEKKV